MSANCKVPIFLEPTKDRIITIIGDGKIALRRCRHFKGFFIRCVTERTVPEIETVCDEIIRKKATLDDIPELIKGSFIVVASTGDRELNREIMKICSDTGILVDSSHGMGSIVIPSTVHRRGYAIAVSSEDSVTSFPAYLTEFIDDELGPEFDNMMALLRMIRKNLPNNVKSKAARTALISEILHNPEIWEFLKEDNMETAYQRAIEIEGKYIDTTTQ